MKLIKSHKCFGGFTEFFEHDSEVTKTKMKFSWHRPSDISKIKGGLIWLSGLTCTEENFITKSGVQKFLKDSGLVIICPDTSPRGLELPREHEGYDFGSGAGFYVDATTEGYKDSYKMYSYINEEIYNLFNKEFNLRNNISLFGHSMGGHGALTIGLKNPELYKSISAFAPIANPTECPWGIKAFSGYLGENRDSWSQYDACTLLKNGANHRNRILIHQGLKDEFFKDQLLTENFEKMCEDTDQNVSLKYKEGYDHSFYFISTFLDQHIEHHKNYLS